MPRHALSFSIHLFELPSSSSHSLYLLSLFSTPRSLFLLFLLLSFLSLLSNSPFLSLSFLCPSLPLSRSLSHSLFLSLSYPRSSFVSLPSFFSFLTLIGMQSVLAETHYDSSRNFAASIGGLRRWILLHPDQCDSLYLLPLTHPSGRHSEVDWTKPDYDQYPKFATGRANEVILTPGSVLYLPTYWFHFIQSLNINFQCNSRSGFTRTYSRPIKKCGFS